MINLRASPRDKALIDQAAAQAGKSRTDFMLDSARKAAEDTLLDQRAFPLSDAQYRAFMRVLDKPPKPSAALRRLMARTPLWQR